MRRRVLVRLHAWEGGSEEAQGGSLLRRRRSRARLLAHTLQPGDDDGAVVLVPLHEDYGR